MSPSKVVAYPAEDAAFPSNCDVVHRIVGDSVLVIFRKSASTLMIVAAIARGLAALEKNPS